MKISILVEGRTEKAFIPHLWKFLQTRLSGNMPKLDILPYHGRIPKENKLKRVVDNRNAPHGNPEQVNNNKPPAHIIKEVFRTGKCRGSYVKPRDAGRILKDNDLMISINACAEFKAFVNTIVSICGGTTIS